MSADLTWVDRLYSHFLGRDLTYVASGLAVIFITQWAWLEEVTVFDALSVRFFAWLLLGYFIGLFGSEGADAIGWLNKVPELPEGAGANLAYQDKVRRECTPGALYAHERTIFLMHVGGGVFVVGVLGFVVTFSSTLWSCCPTVVRPPLGLSILGLLILAVVGWWYQRKKVQQVSDERAALWAIATTK